MSRNNGGTKSKSIKNSQVMRKMQQYKFSILFEKTQTYSKPKARSRKTRRPHNIGPRAPYSESFRASTRTEGVPYAPYTPPNSNGGASSNGDNTADSLPDMNGLIVLAGISLMDGNRRCDSKELIGANKPEVCITNAQLQLKYKARVHPATDAYNNLGCTYAFLYARRRISNLLQDARNSFAIAINIAVVDDDATAAARNNFGIVQRW